MTRRRPIIVGLTGSIAMGKSQAAANFRRLGIPVFDADAEVHRLLAPGGRAVAKVASAFPDAVRDGVVDRQALGAQVFAKPAALKRLEGILHPLVGVARRRFLQRAAAAKQPIVVLDIPLLLEGNGARACDYVVVVSAPGRVQRARALRRPGMTDDKLSGILARQMPDGEKRRRADFIVPTGLDRGFGLRRIRDIVRMIRAGQKSRRPDRRRSRRA